MRLVALLVRHIRCFDGCDCVDVGDAARLWPSGSDLIWLGRDVFCGWCADLVAGRACRSGRVGGTIAYSNSEHFARRIDGFLNPDVDPTTQLGYATNAIREGGFFGVGVGEAGGSPPAHSMISDMFPERQRATALSVFCSDCSAHAHSVDARA